MKSALVLLLLIIPLALAIDCSDTINPQMCHEIKQSEEEKEYLLADLPAEQNVKNNNAPAGIFSSADCACVSSAFEPGSSGVFAITNNASCLNVFEHSTKTRNA